jgi:endonuclease YncB( thermonuclease family)
MLRWLTITAVIGQLAAGTAALAQTPITGAVTHVKDGDTICVGVDSVEVRLEGIDAPEKNEHCWRGASRWKCGPSAIQELRSITANQTLTCEPKYCDDRGRTVALCVAGGVDVAGSMVAAGWAIDWPYYSQGRYRKAQEEAQEAGRGLWTNSGRPTLRMLGRMFQPGTRRSRGPWPPCPARCDRTNTARR